MLQIVKEQAAVLCVVKGTTWYVSHFHSAHTRLSLRIYSPMDSIVSDPGYESWMMPQMYLSPSI